MFMHGPVAHFAFVVDDILFRYVILIVSPGAARITGASFLPSNANDVRPLATSLTANNVTGERVAAGSATICDRHVMANRNVSASSAQLAIVRD